MHSKTAPLQSNRAVAAQSTLDRPLLLVISALVASRVLTMIALPLIETTEPRYAEIARLMAETGDWITPWFSPGVPFWAKPPLAFWFEAISFRLLGVNEFAVRLPSLIATLGTGFLIFKIGYSMYERQTALLAVLIFSTMALTYTGSAAVMTDPFLVLFLTLGLYAIIMDLRNGSTRFQWLFFIGIGLGLLTKGPLTLVLMGGSLALFAAWSVEARTLLRNLSWIRGGFLVLLIAAPWYVAAEIKTPGFSQYFLLGEHFYRFIDPGWTGDLYGSAHNQPPGTIWWYWVWAAFPWSLVLPFLLLRRRPAETFGSSFSEITTLSDTQKILFINALIPCLFFTLSGNILWTYLFPALPALSILLAKPVHGLLGRKGGLIIKSQFLIVPFIVTLLGLTVSVKPELIRSDKVLIQDWLMIAGENRDNLYYIGKMPFSARFYSYGRAQTLSIDEVTQKLKKEQYNPLYVVLKRTSYEKHKNLFGGACRIMNSNKPNVMLKCH